MVSVGGSILVTHPEFAVLRSKYTCTAQTQGRATRAGEGPHGWPGMLNTSNQGKHANLGRVSKEMKPSGAFRQWGTVARGTR